MREPARDNRNDDASDYDKYCAYAYATVTTVTTVATVATGATVATVHGSDHRRRPLSRHRGGSKAVTCTAVIRSPGDSVARPSVNTEGEFSGLIDLWERGRCRSAPRD